MLQKKEKFIYSSILSVKEKIKNIYKLNISLLMAALILSMVLFFIFVVCLNLGHKNLDISLVPHHKMHGMVLGAAVINVKSLGAIGDGATDDRAAISSALSQGCLSGASVYFPLGVYKISSPIATISNCDMTIYGDGSSSSAIKLAGSGSSTYTSMLDFVGVSNTVVIHDMGFWGQNIPAPGISFETFGTVNIYNVIIKDFGTPGYTAGHTVEHDGLYLYSVENVTIRNSIFSGNERDGVIGIPVHTLLATGNIFNGNGEYAGTCESIDNTDGAHDCRWEDNIVTNNGDGGFDVESDGPFSPVYGREHGNYIVHNGNDPWINIASNYALVLGSHSYGDISNNIISDFCSSPATTCLSNPYGTGIAATPIGSTTIENNYVDNAADYGIYINDQGGLITASGNWTTNNTNGTAVGFDVYNGLASSTIISNYSFSNLTANFQISCNGCATSTNFTDLPNDSQTPSVPANLAASVASLDQINLSWDNATDDIGVKGYYVYRNGIKIATTAGTKYPDTGLFSGTNYVYAVASFDGNGNISAKSSGISATTLHAPQAPVINSFSFSPSNITNGNSSILSWDVSGSPTPVIFIDQGIGAATGSSITLTPGQTTTYTLTATNGSGTTTANTMITVTQPVSSGGGGGYVFYSAPPSIPLGLTATTVSISQIKLSWTASTDNVGVVGYNIYRNGAKIASVTDTSYLDHNLSGGTIYTYAISAYDAAGDISAKSNEVQIDGLYETTKGVNQPAILAPVINSFSFSPSNITNGNSSILSWDVSGSPTPVIFIDQGIGAATGSSITLTPGQTTTYTLTATNGSGTTTANTMITVTQAVVLRLVRENAVFFLIKNGEREPFASAAVLSSYGFEFKQAKPATAADKALPLGAQLPPEDGAVIKSKSSSTIYFVSGHSKHAFVSKKVFLELGYKMSSLLIVTDSEFNALPTGSLLDNDKVFHLPGSDISNHGAIYWISPDNTLQEYPSLAVYNSWHKYNNFSSVVPANTFDLLLPISGVVKKRIID